MYFGCFFFNAHGYKYITLNADCVRIYVFWLLFLYYIHGSLVYMRAYVCYISTHRRSFVVDRERKKASSSRYGRERKMASSCRYGRYYPHGRS